MKEVIVIIRSNRWQATREALDELGVREICHQRVLGRGRQQGLHYLRPTSSAQVRGMAFLPKRMASWLVADDRVNDVIAALIRANATGNYGDGKIFVCPVEDGA